MTHREIERLLDHMWWADRRVREVLEAADRPPARAVELYAHVLGAELVWLDRIEGVAQSVAVWPDVDLSGCVSLADRTCERWSAFLSALGPDDPGRAIHYRNSAGLEFDTALEDIVLHVALHGSYHRGQVAILLRDAGAEPAPTDYIGFVRGVPAATRDAADDREPG